MDEIDQFLKHRNKIRQMIREDKRKLTGSKPYSGSSYGCQFRRLTHHFFPSTGTKRQANDRWFGRKSYSIALDQRSPLVNLLKASLGKRYGVDRVVQDIAPKI